MKTLLILILILLLIPHVTGHMPAQRHHVHRSRGYARPPVLSDLQEGDANQHSDVHLADKGCAQLLKKGGQTRDLAVQGIFQPEARTPCEGDTFFFFFFFFFFFC